MRTPWGVGGHDEETEVFYTPEGELALSRTYCNIVRVFRRHNRLARPVREYLSRVPNGATYTTRTMQRSAGGMAHEAVSVGARAVRLPNSQT